MPLPVHRPAGIEPAGIRGGRRRRTTTTRCTKPQTTPRGGSAGVQQKCPVTTKNAHKVFKMQLFVSDMSSRSGIKGEAGRVAKPTAMGTAQRVKKTAKPERDASNLGPPRRVRQGEPKGTTQTPPAEKKAGWKKYFKLRPGHRQFEFTH